MQSMQDFPFPWAVELIRGVFDAPGRNVKMTSWQTLGDKTGFLSDIVKVNLNAEKSCDGQNVPKSVVLKIATAAKGLSESNNPDVDDAFGPQFMMDMHTKECMFYNFAMKHGPVNLPIPKCYLALDNRDSGGPNLLILEDLSEGTGQQCMVEGLTLGQLQNYVAALAHFNAFSLSNDAWKSVDFSQSVWGNISKFPKIIMPCSDDLRKEFPQDYTLDRSILEQMNSDMNLWREEFCAEEGKFEPAVVNGDMWTYNLMFEKTGTGVSDKVVSFLDWQWCTIGSVTQDIARLMSNSVTVEMRRENTHKILQHFYTTLETTLAGMGKSIPFDFESVLRWYRRSAKVASLLSQLDLPQAGINYARSLPDGENKARLLVRRNVAFVEDAYFERF